MTCEDCSLTGYTVVLVLVLVVVVGGGGVVVVVVVVVFVVVVVCLVATDDREQVRLHDTSMPEVGGPDGTTTMSIRTLKLT